MKYIHLFRKDILFFHIKIIFQTNALHLNIQLIKESDSTNILNSITVFNNSNNNFKTLKQEKVI